MFDCSVFVRIFARPFERPTIRFQKTNTSNPKHNTSGAYRNCRPHIRIVSSGNGMPITILNRNEPAFHCVPAAAYEALMELIGDAELKESANEPAVRVTLDDL